MEIDKKNKRTISVEFAMGKPSDEYKILRSDVDGANKEITSQTDQFMVPISLSKGNRTYNETTLEIIQERDSGAIAVFVFMMICTGREVIKVGGIETDKKTEFSIKTSNIDHRILNCVLTSVNFSSIGLTYNHSIKIIDAEKAARLTFSIDTLNNTLFPSILLHGFPRQKLKFVATTEIYTLD